MRKKNFEQADYMLNIDISFLRDLVYSDYFRTKKFITYYAAYNISEAITSSMLRLGSIVNFSSIIIMDDTELDMVFKEFCLHNSSQQIYEYRFKELLSYREFLDFIVYTNNYIQLFSNKLIDKITSNIVYYQDKKIVVSPTIVSVNVLSLTTKVVYAPSQ